MNTQQLDYLIDKLTSESRDLAINEVFSIVNNPSLKENKLNYWMVKEIALTVRQIGLNNASQMQIAILDAFYKKLC